MLLQRLAFSNPTLQRSSRIFIPRLSIAPVFISTMSVQESEFPPKALREIVAEVATLLKERKETVSVAETVLKNLKRFKYVSNEKIGCRWNHLRKHLVDSRF